MHRRTRPDRFPPHRTVVEFRHTGPKQQTIWLLLELGAASVCTSHPGFDVDIVVSATTPALSEVFNGYTHWVHAVEQEPSRSPVHRALLMRSPPGSCGVPSQNRSGLNSQAPSAGGRRATRALSCLGRLRQGIRRLPPRSHLRSKSWPALARCNPRGSASSTPPSWRGCSVVGAPRRSSPASPNGNTRFSSSWPRDGPTAPSPPDSSSPSGPWSPPAPGSFASSSWSTRPTSTGGCSRWSSCCAGT